MGSRCRKALLAESVRDSLHSWCKRVKDRSKRDMLHSITTRSTCSLGSTIDEGDEIITVASGTLSPCSSTGSLNQLDITETFNPPVQELSFRITEDASNPLGSGLSVPPVANGPEDDNEDREDGKVETLLDLFNKT